MNQCLDQCARPLKHQKEYALSIYNRFNSRLYNELELQCLKVGERQEDSECVQQVQGRFGAAVAGQYKGQYQRYLEFLAKE